MKRKIKVADMLEFKDDFLTRVESCEWLCHCGQYDDLMFDFPVRIIKDKKTAIKSICSLDGENICLEHDGDFTVFLHLNHNKEYNQFWNVIVKNVKEVYIENIMDKVHKALSERDLTEDVATDVKSNLITLFMLNFYSDFGYDDPFWKQMFEIYMAGYLPCGWTGNSESGEFIIY